MRFIVQAAVLVLSLATAVLSQTSQGEPQTFLRRQLGISSYEIDAMEKGQIIAKLPKTGETREVAAFAIMRLDIPAEFFMERVRDIVTFKKSESVLQIGKFGNPPRLEDLASLTLDSVDVEAIKRCKLNSCDLKMSARMIDRFRKDVNWSAPNYPERATQVVREMLLETVQSYLQGGNAALGEYNDKAYRLRLADEFAALLQPAPYMYEYVPEFQQYLKNFPNSRPSDVEDFVYWSKEKFGLKPVVSLTHVAMYKLQKPNGTDVLIASKGIYATHYFEASLGLTGFIQGQSTGPERSYLIYINRTRTDALRGLFAGLKRTLISGTLRDGAKKNMEMIKKKLEDDYNKQNVGGTPP